MTDIHARDGDNVAERNAEYLRALDLHDETGQILTAILVNLQHLGSRVSSAEMGETVRDTQHLVETLFYSIRNFIRESRREAPRAAPSRPDLGGALRRLAVEFSRRTGVAVDLRVDGETERIPGEHKAVFYRVVQECLTNVFRHSSASGVRIAVTRAPEAVHLRLEEEGAAGRLSGRAEGPIEEAGAGRVMLPAGGGAGLRGIRERVRIVGGDCSVEFDGGRGMTVRVVLPYNIA